jgi:hypothetical protein
MARMRLPDAALVLAGAVLVATTARGIEAASAGHRVHEADATVFLRYLERSGGRYAHVYVHRVLDTPGRRLYRVCANHVAAGGRRANYRVCGLVDRTNGGARVVAVRRFSLKDALPPVLGGVPS